MTTREEALAKAAQDFIDKVDRGEARSVKSYAAFKAALRLASRQEVSVEELALELMNARRRMTGLEELSAERVKKIGLWPLKEETMCAASALLAEYVITKRTTEG